MTREEVERAIREGVRYLKNDQRADGSWVDVHGEVPVTFSEEPLDGDRLDARTEATIEEVKRTSFPFFGLRL